LATALAALKVDCMDSILTRFVLRAATALLVLVGTAHAGDETTHKGPDTPVGMMQDFDSQHGRWHTTVRRLLKPLQGSQEWAEYEGTGVVHPLLGGRANVAELDVSGPRGRIQGVSVRLFDARTQRWTIQFANVASGVLDAGISGGFAGGRRGVFYGPDTLNGRPIVVRFIIDVVDAQTVRFEQSFSPNGGVDWELNWVAVDQRM
jgi:hypothetical protein